MTNALLFAAAAALAISTGGAASAATPITSNKASIGKAQPPVGREPGLTVLYDQTEDDGGVAIVSQKFESEYATYDSQAADDFTVPKGTFWLVKEVEVTGQYFNGSGPATSENVVFYKDNAKTSLPAKVIKTEASLKGKDNGTGSFTIKLPTAVKLTPGHYWVSVQANLAFSNGGEWGWENTSTSQSFGAPAAWVNKKNGFATGCTKYTIETTCIPDGQGPDHLFTLLGTAK